VSEPVDVLWVMKRNQVAAFAGQVDVNSAGAAFARKAIDESERARAAVAALIEAAKFARDSYGIDVAAWNRLTDAIEACGV
jgi:hypothetical protein